MANVTLRGVRKAFGEVEIIKGVDFDVPDGEFCVFVGPSGCGKSTLLRMIAGLDDITSGELKIGERDMTSVEPADRGVAMVFQSDALYPHMTVRDNIGFGLRMTGHAKSEIDERTRRAADMQQLGTLLDRKPSQLSGGQRQRVAIGRAIVRQPGVFLFDELLSNLDAARRVQMRIEIGKLHQSLKATMIYVTHDQVEAMTMADRIVVLNAGRIEPIGSPLDLYHRPGNLFVAGFIGSPKMKFIPSSIVELGRGTMTLAMPVGAAKVGPMQKVTLGVRPEHLSATGAGDGAIVGPLRLAEYLGSKTMFYVSLPDRGELAVKADGFAKAKVGDSMTVGGPATACHVFEEAGQTLVNATLEN